jgi:hypothetical protein
VTLRASGPVVILIKPSSSLFPELQQQLSTTSTMAQVVVEPIAMEAEVSDVVMSAVQAQQLLRQVRRF